MADEKKVLVALGKTAMPGDPATVVFAFTPAAWDQMQNGQTHDFDLTKVGLPVKVIMFRGDSYADIEQVLKEGAEASGAAYDNQTGGADLPDLGIDKPRTH